MQRIEVELGERSYPVLIDRAARKKGLARQVERCTPKEGSVFVVFDAQVYALFGAEILKTLAPVKRRVTELVIPPGERAKSASVLQDIYTFLLENGVSRSDFILAVGGGVVTDLAGYAAATTLRGLRWGAVPTTLLGMVDAAIGGKTGINHPLGKNLIGAFWQPSFVLCDLTFLETLPGREFLAGMGEVAKYAGLAGGEFVDRLEAYLVQEDLLDHDSLGGLIELSAAYKAETVACDEREGRLRMRLNLGHTFGHAIEKALGYGRLLHGEAVLLGLDGAIELSAILRPVRRKRLARYQSLVRRLITKVPYHTVHPDRVVAAMAFDKKRAGETLRFVLLDSPGHPIITEAVPEAAVRDAVALMLEHYVSKGARHAPNSRGQRS